MWFFPYQFSIFFALDKLKEQVIETRLSSEECKM